MLSTLSTLALVGTAAAQGRGAGGRDGDFHPTPLPVRAFPRTPIA